MLPEHVARTYGKLQNNNRFLRSVSPLDPSVCPQLLALLVVLTLSPTAGFLDFSA